MREGGRNKGRFLMIIGVPLFLVSLVTVRFPVNQPDYLDQETEPEQNQEQKMGSVERDESGNITAFVVEGQFHFDYVLEGVAISRE